MDKNARNLIKKVRKQEKVKHGYTPTAAIFGKGFKKHKEISL